MSWHYLQAGEEASWEDSSMDGAPDALLRLIPTAEGHFLPDSETAASNPSPSGMTCAPSMEDHGEDPSTSLPVDSHARTSAQPAKEQASQERGADSGKSLPASFAKWDPDTCSWRTHQYSLLGGLELYSETWPRWGMMHNGESFQLPTPSGLLALRAWITSESESGSSAPTPTKCMQKGSSEASLTRKNGRSRENDRLDHLVLSKRLPSIRKSDSERGGRGDLIQAVRGNPNKHWTRMQTPTVQDANGRDRHNQKDGSVILSLLGECRRLQTPVADDAVDRKEGKFNSRGEPKLSAQVKRMATVTKSDGSGGPGRSESRTGGDNLRTQVGGSLNPEWTEWFMGWPTGWTDLAPLGMDRLQQWFDSHGIS